MSIAQTIVNGSQTAISVGGGNFLTQSGAVARHTFHRSLVLAEGESADAWREVTPAQKAQIEAEDAARTRPPQTFIDYWNASCVYCEFNGIVDRFGEYVEESYLFELCGTLLTYEEALEVAPMFTREIMATYMENKYCNLMVRAIPAVPCSSWGCSYKHTFAASIKLERIRFSAKTAGGLVRITDGSMMFLACSALKVIEGTLYINENANTEAMFSQCVKLREVRIITLKSLSLKDSPELSDESIAYLINHREGSKAITVTLHPTAYARVTDELFETAASKNITIASA